MCFSFIYEKYFWNSFGVCCFYFVDVFILLWLYVAGFCWLVRCVLFCFFWGVRSPFLSMWGVVGVVRVDSTWVLGMFL